MEMLKILKQISTLPRDCLLSPKPYSRLFLFNNVCIIIYDKFILFNNIEIFISTINVQKKNNTLEITDPENIYILDFTLFVITNKVFMQKTINRSEFSINKENLQCLDIVITDDNISYKGHKCENIVKYTDFDDLEVFYYSCIINEYIFISNDKSSSIIMFNKKLEEISNEIIYVKCDEEGKSKYLRGLDSREDCIGQINERGEVEIYKIKERSEEGYYFKEYVGEESRNVFHKIIKSEGTKSNTIEAKSEQIGQSDIGRNRIEFDTEQSEIDDASYLNLKDIEKMEEDTTKGEEDNMQEDEIDKERYMEEDKIFEKDKMEEDNIKTQEETFKTLEEDDMEEESKILEMSNIFKEDNKDKDDLKTQEQDDIHEEDKDDKEDNMQEESTNDLSLKSEKETIKSFSDFKSQAHFSFSSIKEVINNKSNSQDNDAVDKIIKDIKNIKVNKSTIRDYKYTEYNLDSKLHSLYRDIMKLEDPRDLQRDMENDLLFMINKIQMRQSVDSEYIKKSIKYYDKKINQRNKARIPFIYNRAIIEEPIRTTTSSTFSSGKSTLTSGGFCMVELEKALNIESMCNIIIQENNNKIDNTNRLDITNTNRVDINNNTNSKVDIGNVTQTISTPTNICTNVPSSGSSIPTVKKETETPNAFSRFASSNNLF